MTQIAAVARLLARFSLLLAVVASAQLVTKDADASDLQLTQQLNAIASGEGVANALFGWSVAVDNDIAVVATVGTAETPGKLRTYKRIGANWTRMLSHEQVIAGDTGARLSFRGGNLILSAYKSTAPTRSFTQLYRYTETGWVNEYNLASNTEVYGDVATQGEIAVVGLERYEGPAGYNQGRVRFLRRQSNGQWSSVYQSPTTPQAGALFGSSVAIVSGAIVVGAPRESVTHGGTTYPRAGAAYVYELTGDTWNEVARLTEPSGSTLTDNRFASAVAISGTDPGTPDRMLISRPSSETTGRAGIVRSYTRPNGTWTQKATISAPTPSAADAFGYSLALDGNWGVIGARSSDAVASNAGAIFIAHFNSTFLLSGMTQRTDPLAAVEDFMGSSVALDRDGPTVIVGNFGADVYGNPNQGVVLAGHSDNESTPTLSRAMDLGQGLSNANAGIVALDGDTLLVGAHRENIGLQHERGAVYEYRRMPDGQYAYQSRILAPDGMAGDNFGYRMAIQGDIAMISSIGRSLGGQSSAGAVYVFHRDAGVWTLEAQLLPATIGYEITFGFSLALDGSTAFIGEFGENTSVYQRSNGGMWTPVQSIPHRAWAVQLRGDLALLADSNTNNVVGDVATYTRSGGQWQAQGALNGTSANQGFGRDISLSVGNTLAVTSSTPATPVLLYRRSGTTWLPEASLLPDDVTSNTYCSRVATTATSLAIGCSTSGSPGVVYVFGKNGSLWEQTQKLTLAPIQSNDLFGASLAWNPSGALFAGAPARDLDFENQGAVYVYEADVLFKNGFD